MGADVGDRIERMQDVVVDPADKSAVLEQAELRGLLFQLLLVRARASDHEARAGQPLDQLRHRLEGVLEALLVDEAADQQHELLLRGGELAPQALQLGGVLGLQVMGVVAVGDHPVGVLVDAEDVGDLLGHVGRADGDPVAAVDDPALDAVDVGLGVLVHIALVAAVLGGVDRHHQRRLEALGEVVARVGHEPVVSVDEVEGVAVAELDAGGEHVGVHALDPGDELVELRRARRLAHAMDANAIDDRLGLLLAATGEDVDLDVALDQALGDLLHDPGQPALDQGRVLP